MRLPALILSLVATLLQPLLFAVPAHADAASESATGIRMMLGEAERLRAAMGPDTWRAIQSDLIRLRTLKSTIESIGGEIASEETRLREIGERVEWLRLDADTAIQRHNRARAALDRDIDAWNRRAKALEAAIDWHNAHPPSPYDHAAVARYNANKRNLERRQARLNRERAQLIAREANTILPLRLAASKKERAWREKRAEGLRLMERVKARVATLNEHIGEARRIGVSLVSRVDRGIREQEDAAPPRPTPAPRPSVRPTPARELPPAEMRSEQRSFLPVVAPGDLITRTEYDAALRNRARVQARYDAMLAELEKVRGRSRSTLEEQRKLYEVKRRALRDIVDDLLSLVDVDKLMKGLRLAKGIKRAWLTPRQAEQVRLALEAAKAAAELGMADSEPTNQARRHKLIGALADGDAALARAKANLGSAADRGMLRRLALAHTAIKAASKIAGHAADRKGTPAADLSALGELTVDLAALVVPVVKLPQATAKLLVHWREQATAHSILEDLSFARAMHARADRALTARAKAYRAQLFELEMTVRKYERR